MAIHAESNIKLEALPAYTTLLEGHFRVGNGAANVVQNSVDNEVNWGYNTHIGSNGIQLRHGAIVLSEWTTNFLQFYNPITRQVNARLDGEGLILSKGGIKVGTVGSDSSVYLSSDNLGSVIPLVPTPLGSADDKTDWLAVIGSKFAVDSQGNLYANNANLSNATVQGEITASQLTISPSGETSYSGISAINATGYTIEIVNDNTAMPGYAPSAIPPVVPPEGQTYIYPIMRQNGEIINYLLTSDVMPESGKNYYIRTYDSTTGQYSYTLVENPTTPKANGYYELINKTNYLWTYNGSQTSVHGDATLGGILADYGKTYRVSYILSDDVVGEVPSVQTIEVDPQKYITRINEYGIKIHPESWTNQSSYIQLDGTGLELFSYINNNTVSLAKYGTTARIGIPTSSRFEIDTDSLAGYNSNNVKYFEVSDNNLQFGNNAKFVFSNGLLQAFNGNMKYFEVSANRLSWGSNVAATNGDIGNALSVYLTDITGGGVYVHASDTPSDPSALTAQGVKITDKIDIIRNGISVMSVGEIINPNTANERAIVRIGQTGETRAEIDFHSLQLIDAEGDTYFHISDLRDAKGSVDRTLTFIGDGSKEQFTLVPIARSTDYTITTSNDSGGAIKSRTYSSFQFTNAPDEGTIITVNFQSSHSSNKAFTIGVRDDGYLGSYSYAEGYGIVASGVYSHAEGNYSTASGEASHAEGTSTASGYTCHAEGYSTASGNYSHSEGCNTTASGFYSHVEGHLCTASGARSHAEGGYTEATEWCAHSEGWETTASGEGSHAEGHASESSEEGSHAEGISTIASGKGSHAGGYRTEAAGEYQTVIGKFNDVDSNSTYAFIIGKGDWNTPLNAFTVDWNGNAKLNGTTTVTSDRRLKEHKSYLSKDAIDFIRSLKPAYFLKDSKPHLGFYAQDVEEIDSWNCMTGEMNGFKTLGYTEIIAPLVAYCQHLEERIKQLEEKE